MKYFLFLCFMSFAYADTSLFPKDYESSRARFRVSCGKVAVNMKGRCGTFALSLNEDLTVEYGVFTSPAAKKLLIVISGNHGPEAYSGAAAQELLMRNYMPMLSKAMIDVVLVHALNPYGFKFNRRTDKDNVNLNRNFATTEELFKTPNENYNRFRSILEPKGPVGGTWESVALRLKMMGYLIQSGFQTKGFAQGMNSGQYQYPQGLAFGGFQFQPQVKFLRDLLAPMFPKYKDVLLLDMHTGLGARNTLHIMKGERISHQSLVQAQNILNFDAEKDAIIFTSGDDKGFYPTTGDLIDFVSTIAPKETNVMPLVFEFGTVGKGLFDQMSSAILLIMENQSGIYQCERPDYCNKLRADFLQMFNPDHEEWREQYLDKMNKVFSAIISRF